MKTRNVNRMLIWAVIVLAVLNITTFASILFHSVRADKATQLQQYSQKQPETITEDFSGRYFCDRLGFSSGQFDSFRSFNPQFRQQARDIYMQLNDMRSRMFYEMNSENRDINKLESLSDSIGILHGNLKRLTYKYYIDMKDICDAEQQEKLRQMFEPVFMNDTQSCTQGGRAQRGMHQGMRHGRRFDN